MNIATHRGWNETVMEMSKCGKTDEWEWFSESFANSQNAIDDRDFEGDPNLTDENNRRQKLINQACLVGEFCEQCATRFGSCDEKAPP